MLQCHRYCCVSLERNPSCEHLIEHDTERIYITLLITISAPCLLRRNVMHRSHRIGIDRIGGSRPGNTKISYLYLTFLRYNNILGLNIAMHYVMIMSCFNSLSYLDSYAYSLSYTKPALLFYIFFEGYSLYQFHNNIVYSIFITDIIYVYNISVYKSCRRLCFHTELSHKRPVFTKFRLKNLNGYKAIQLMILRLVHIRHSSGSNLSKYLISICNKYRLFHITSY